MLASDVTSAASRRCRSPASRPGNAARSGAWSRSISARRAPSSRKCRATAWPSAPAAPVRTTVRGTGTLSMVRFLWLRGNRAAANMPRREVSPAAHGAAGPCPIPVCHTGTGAVPPPAPRGTTQTQARSDVGPPGRTRSLVHPWRCAPSLREGAIRARGGPSRSCAFRPVRGYHCAPITPRAAADGGTPGRGAIASITSQGAHG